MLTDYEKKQLLDAAERRRMDSACGSYTIIASDRHNGLRITHRFTVCNGQTYWQPWSCERM